MALRIRAGAGLATLLAVAGIGFTDAPSALALRPIPDTTGTIAVWDDQLPDDMTAAQVRFVASHIAGTQKVSLQTARRLRAVNPRFLVLHYRLAIGDGPVPFRIGDHWASDYATVRPHSSWFWHQDGRRVLNRQWNWYLMNPSSGWRAYWVRRVRYEARLLGDDGVFADSLSVPQYLGASSFSPPLRYFVGERAWMRRIDAFMHYVERQLHGRLWFIPNAGSWITTRDRTDYAIPDGVMVEGFAEPGAGASYATGDWELQMNRVLSLTRRGRIVIGQTYPAAGDVRARLFALGSYLLTKGRHSFINLDVAGIAAQWLPEYGIDLGAPLSPPAAGIDRLRIPGGLFLRRFAHGEVAVNPTGSARSYRYTGTLDVVTPHGGGALAPDAHTTGWRLSYGRATRSVTVPAHSAVILLRGRTGSASS
ncbi:MAG: putative glycoside hydrolase [Solirubrobacteraceae bacterium]